MPRTAPDPGSEVSVAAVEERPGDTDVETSDRMSADMTVEDVPGTTETVTYYAPPATPDDAISYDSLLLAEYYGRQGQSNEVTQKHVEALEDFLRSHAVGGSTRTSEGFYGSKTRALVNTATEHYLGTEGNGIVSRELIDALRAAGAQTTG